MKLRVLSAAVLGLYVASATADLQQGIEAYKKGDFAAAIQAMRPLAEQGDAQAQYNLGLMYDTGRGVAQDPKEAANWYRRAAEQGNARAQKNLAVMYDTGRGVARDDQEAAKWYRLAAAQGDTQSQLALGLMHDAGRGVTQDPKEAAHWYRQAAERGNAQAQGKLAALYTAGRGVTPDPVAAYLLYELAANQGDPEAVQERERLAKTLTPDQISQAQGQAKTWAPGVPLPVQAVETVQPSETVQPVESAQPGPVQEGVEAPPPPRAWAVAPGMRLFHRQLPDPQSVPVGSIPAAIAALPDGGYWVAGSVRGPGGREVWVTRYDAGGLLSGTRALGGPLDLEVRGIAAMADGGCLIVGDLGKDRPGFLLMLDAAGEPRWSRVSSAGTPPARVPERLLAVATQGNGLALAVGDQPVEQGGAFALAVAADGSSPWRLDLPDAVNVRAVIPQGDGWLVAGEARAPARSAWLGQVDATGKLAWQRVYGESGGGAALALAPLPNGEILLAGQPGEGGAVWVRRLSATGETLAEQTPVLRVQDQPMVRELLGLAVAADGGYWLSGVSTRDDGWVARLDAAGVPRWARLYGHAGADGLQALLARPAGGAVAVGRSEGEGQGGAHGLWTVSLDEAGEPLAAAPLSDTGRMIAMELTSLSSGDGLRLGGAPEVTEAADGPILILLPFLYLQEQLPIAPEVAEVGPGELRVDVRNDQGVWRVVADLPNRLPVRDAAGNDIGRLDMARDKLELDWDEAGGFLARLDIALEGFQFNLDGTPRLAGLYEALGLPHGPLAGADPTALGQMSLAALRVSMIPQTQPDGKLSTSFEFAFKDWRYLNRSGVDIGHLGEARISSMYRDLDRARLLPLSNAFAALMSGSPEADAGATPRQLVEQAFQAMGSGKGEFHLTDLAVGAPDSPDMMRLEGLTIAGQGGPSASSKLHFDTAFRYGLRGLQVRQPSGESIQVGSLELTFGLDRLSVGALADAALAAATGGEPTPETLLELTGQLLGGAALGFSLNDVTGQLEGAEGTRIGKLTLRVALGEADTPSPKLTLDYHHEGVSGIPEAPPEVLPRAAAIKLSLSEVPLSALVTGLLEGQALRLDADQVDIDMPVAGIQVKGVGFARGPATAETPPLVSAKADILVRDLDALVAWVGTSMSEEDRQGLEAAVALLKVAGVQEKGDGGSVLHRFAVEWDGQGKLTINGKDLTPLVRSLQ